MEKGAGGGPWESIRLQSGEAAVGEEEFKSGERRAKKIYFTRTWNGSLKMSKVSPLGPPNGHAADN